MKIAEMEKCLAGDPAACGTADADRYKAMFYYLLCVVQISILKRAYLSLLKVVHSEI